MFKKFLSKVKFALKNCLEMELLIGRQVIITELNSMNVLASSSLIDPESDVIVSLTTYSKRIHDVYLTIESLGLQTKKAKKIILWLDKEEFDLNCLPESINRLVSRGLDVEFCDNLRSYKKLVPTLELYPFENIITVDDDMIYPSDLIDRFRVEAKIRPNVVLCNRAHLAKFDSKLKLKSYVDWDHDIQTDQARFEVVPTGIGGVYYPKGCFDERVMDSDAFLRLCPQADDLWFKLMTSLNGVPSYVLPRNSPFTSEFVEIGRSKDIALTSYNLREGGNDDQINSIETEFKFSDNLRKTIDE